MKVRIGWALLALSCGSAEEATTSSNASSGPAESSSGAPSDDGASTSTTGSDPATSSSGSTDDGIADDSSTGDPAPSLWTQGCLPSADVGPEVAIAWDELRNPIVAFDDHAVKDMSVRWVDGRWQMMFSYIADDPFRFRVGRVDSEDWASWTPEPETWDQPRAGGLASADITQRSDGTYVVVFNTHTYDAQRPEEILNKLYYRTSADFVRWSPITRLVDDLWNGADDRLIDAALAHTEFGIVVGFKYDQTFRMAYSPSGSLDGPWTPIGDPVVPGGLENYQFLVIDGQWHLLGTSLDAPEGYDREHMPVLHRLMGDAASPQSWLQWEVVGVLAPPLEAWNGAEAEDDDWELANAAFLCDARAVDGYFYLFYAGSNEVETFEGRGHAKIGVARSPDLQDWESPLPR